MKRKRISGYVMYVCQVCRVVVGPGVGRTVHVIQRPSPRHNGLEVAAEIPVCRECLLDLESGKSLRSLVRDHEEQRVAQKKQKPKESAVFHVEPIKLSGSARMSSNGTKAEYAPSSTEPVNHEEEVVVLSARKRR